MSTTQELLKEYNTLATKLGQPTLKAWKGPKTDLQSRLNTLKVKQLKTPSTKNSKPKNPDEVTVVEIAKELKIDPKVARAKLRRRGMTASSGRWRTFKRGTQEFNRIVRLLKNGRKTK